MNAIDWRNCPAVEKRPDVTTGYFVFRGSNVPVLSLFQHFQMQGDIAGFHQLHEAVRWEDIQTVLAFLVQNSAT